MTTISCPHCMTPIETKEGQTMRFCPFCGKALAEAPSQAPATDIPAPQDKPLSELAQRVAAEKRPQKKYKIILEALKNAPDDFEANKALLYHGRLHEPMSPNKGKTLDFSIIKSNLLCVFDEPEKFPAAVIDAKYEELLRDPQLKKTMELSGDGDAFFAEYIYKLAYEYVDLFIRGDSRYATVAFGFGRSAESLARKCSEPVKRMLEEMRRTDRLTETERILLIGATRDAYGRVFGGYASFLNE